MLHAKTAGVKNMIRRSGRSPWKPRQSAIFARHAMESAWILASTACHSKMPVLIALQADARQISSKSHVDI
jgi:hypothetical protein